MIPPSKRKARYVPAPPPRQSGYRETQFDQLLSDYLNQGFQLIQMKTVPHHSPEQNGFWMVCVLSSSSNHPIAPIEEEIQEKESLWEYNDHKTKLEVE